MFGRDCRGADFSVHADLKIGSKELGIVISCMQTGIRIAEAHNSSISKHWCGSYANGRICM